jgi:hypothetical protein
MDSKDAYTVAEVSKLTHWSRRTIVRMFEREPGVIFSKAKATGTRRSLRIPRAVYQRVIRKLTVR